MKNKWIYLNTWNKILLLLVWAPGSWKSSFVWDNKLSDYTISMDQFRFIVWEVSLTLDNYSGEWVSQDYNKRVADIFIETLEDRMSKWLFTVIDNTNLSEWAYNDYYKLADKYGYQIFFKSFPKTLNELKKINKTRWKKEVNDEVLTAMVDKYNNLSRNNFSAINKRCTQINYISDLPNFIPVEPNDFSLEDAKEHFRAIYFIWDIQGCPNELQTFLDTYYSVDCCYVFTWDLLDRWYDNYWVLDIVYNLIALRNNNVFFIRGNHDEYIEKHLANGRNPVWRTEFDTNTIPQIMFFPTDKLKTIANQFLSSVTIKWWKNVLFASHWGVNKLRNFISDKQLCRWVGRYEEHQLCDNLFEDFSHALSYQVSSICYQDINYYSIHWHRNSENSPIQSSKKTFNLEGKIEHGGDLRVVAFYQNDEFECINIQSIKQNNKENNMNNFDIETLSQNEYLNIKELNNWLYSVNFTREAFKKWVWDNTTLKARGLFIDASGNVYARSYNKFFNIWEKPETNLEALPRTLWFPINVYYKYNGFLGIVWYKDGEVLYCSKSTNEGRFSDMVREMLQPYEDKMLPYLKQWLSLVFEIMHPTDIHIVEQPFIPVLLDVIVNDIHDFNKYDYHSLIAVANDIWISYKEHYWTIINEKELFETIEYLKNYTNEWFILEGPNGTVKLKTDYYVFWKKIRSDLKHVTKFIKEKIANNIGRLTHSTILEMNELERRQFANRITIEDKYWEEMPKEMLDIINYIFHYDLDLSEHNYDKIWNVKMIVRLQNLAIPYRSISIPEIAATYYSEFPEIIEW